MSNRRSGMSSFSLANREQRERSGEKQHVLSFRLGGRIRGLAADRIVRVAEIHHFSPLPSDLRCNLGLVTHRGVVAGLVDLELLEQLNTASQNPQEILDKQSPTKSAGPDDATSKAALPFSSLPFFCIFARFPRGVAGFPIEQLLALESLPGNSKADNDEYDENDMLPHLDMIDIDALEIFE